MKNENNNLVSLLRLSKRLNISALWLKEQADIGRIPCLNAKGKLIFNEKAVKVALAKLAAKGGSDGN